MTVTREKKSIASLVGKRFDTTVGWSGESDRIFKLKLAGVLSDGDTDNSSDNASADTSYDSAVQDEESDESLDISDSYSEKSQTIYCDMDSLKRSAPMASFTVSRWMAMVTATVNLSTHQRW